ncbi:OLC1v1019837C1 [Oldenlandia corymbosa var. corymbosa]|uniref:OLC1v1019837C1 n=1 Tax=Oldenlandia corymbosa var. corymbosa TaxID=529605 RepID=A0AAV1EF21_OLDCO|nr:OLC1v1019837C1 [Oldenlandia corymbosa var. corymbosa]
MKEWTDLKFTLGSDTSWRRTTDPPAITYVSVSVSRPFGSGAIYFLVLPSDNSTYLVSFDVDRRKMRFDETHVYDSEALVVGSGWLTCLPFKQACRGVCLPAEIWIFGDCLENGQVWIKEKIPLPSALQQLGWNQFYSGIRPYFFCLWI